MRTFLASRGHCVAAVASLLIASCGASATPPAATPASEQRAPIAQPCAGVPGDAAPASGYTLAFIQAAQNESTSVLSFMGDDGVPATMTWDASQVTVTPALPQRSSDPVVLAVQLQRDGQMQQAKLETRNQQPVAMALDEGGTLVFTPYLIAGDADMQRLMACKASAASREP